MDPNVDKPADQLDVNVENTPAHQPGQTFQPEEQQPNQPAPEIELAQPIAPPQTQTVDEERPKRSKKLIILMVTLLIVAVVGIAVFMLFVRNSDNNNVTSPFDSISSSISDEELLALTLSRLLSIQNVSYSINFTSLNAVTGNVEYDFSGGKPKLYANTMLHDDNGNLTMNVEVYIDKAGGNTFFKINELGDKSAQNEWSKFVGKWVLINEETTQNIAAGSEYIGLLLFQGTNWELPFLIGNFSDNSSVVYQLTDSSLYKITESEDLMINGAPAVKLTVEGNKKSIADVLNPFTGLDATMSLNSTTPGVTLYVNRYSDEPVKPTTFSLTILRENAQLVSAENILDESEVGGIGQTGNSYDYSNFSFGGTDIGKEPRDSIPFNQFWPSD